MVFSPGSDAAHRRLHGSGAAGTSAQTHGHRAEALHAKAMLTGCSFPVSHTGFLEEAAQTGLVLTFLCSSPRRQAVSDGV